MKFGYAVCLAETNFSRSSIGLHSCQANFSSEILLLNANPVMGPMSRYGMEVDWRTLEIINKGCVTHERNTTKCQTRHFEIKNSRQGARY
jgi:hypothetical protein